VVATGSDGVATIDKNRLDKKKNNKNTPAKPSYTDWDMGFAINAAETIRQTTNPDLKQPNLEVWAKDARLMRERDSRSPEDMQRMWQWARSNTFWQANILSISKFREKFDQLVAQANRPIQPVNDQFKTAQEKRADRNAEIFDIEKAGSW
jgi:hypothetical protein